MINNFKSKIVSLFLSKDNKEKIEKENNLILSLSNKYKEFHVINSEELNFYNLLVINIEKMFKSNEFDTNENFTFKTEIDKIDGGSIDGSTYTEKKILFSIINNNRSKSIEVFDGIEETLYSYCNTVWKHNFELVREKSQLLYGTDVENFLKKKIDKVLGKKILNQSNRYQIYKELLVNSIESYKLDLNIQEKYVNIIDDFIENLKNSQIPKNMEITLNNINYNGVFLFINEKGLFLKKDQYKDFIKKHNKELLQSEIEKVLSIVINQDKPKDLYIQQRYKSDGILRFTIKDNKNVLYEGNYGLLLEAFNQKYRKANIYLKKDKIDNDEYLTSMFGIEFSDYIKNEINTKKASEQKKELDQVLLSSENKVIHTTKKRI